MAIGMKPAVAALALATLAPAAGAQVLIDPMRPPSYADAASDQSPDSIVLQSIILSAGRKLAVINGRTYRAGDRLGDARIAAISANSVTLKQGKETKVLTLLPDSVARSSGGADKRASRKSGAGPEERR